MNPRFSNIRPFILSTGVFGAIFAASITQAACVTAGSEKTTSETQIQEAPVHVEKKIEVRVDGKDVQVIMNGKPVPAGQIRDMDGVIVIVGDDGTELQRIELAGMRGGGDAPVMVRKMMVKQDDGRSEPPRGMLGVMMAENDRGVVIQRVIPETPAAQAGLREGDIIIKINGRPANVEALANVVAGTRPGQSIEVNGLRDGQNFDREIVLGRWDPEVMDASQNREREGDHDENREIHMEWNGDDDGELGMEAIESLIERLMTMNGNGDGDVEFDVQVEMEGNRDGRERRVKIRQGDMVFHAGGEGSEFIIQGGELHGDAIHDEQGNMFFSRDESGERDDHVMDVMDVMDVMEKMMRDGRHEIEAWMGEMSDEAGRWAQDAEHQMHDFAEMFDDRMGEMAAAFEQELHRVMERQDHGRRETEMMFRERDIQLKEGGMMLQQRLGESRGKLQETLQKFAEGHQRLAEQNQRLTERVERLEQALRRMMEGGRDVGRDSEARNRNQDQVEDAPRKAEKRKDRAAEESEQDRRKASDRPRRQGGERGDAPAKGSERDRD